MPARLTWFDLFTDDDDAWSFLTLCEECCARRSLGATVLPRSGYGICSLHRCHDCRVADSRWSPVPPIEERI